MFGSSSEGVGVDIGATAVRVVATSGLAPDGFQVVSRIGIHPLPEGAVRAGKVVNHQQVAAALTKALKNAKVPPQGFVLGMSGAEMAVTRLKLPVAIKPTERVAVVRNSSKEISPLVPLASAALGINHVRRDISGEGQEWDELVVAAVLQDDVDSLMALCKLARVAPRAIDLSGVALLRSLVRTTEGSRDIATVVDIGATKTTVVTREGLHARNLRCVPIGGNDITRALQEVRGEPWEEAERRKQFMRLGSISTVNDGPVDLSSYGLEEDDQLLEDRSETKIEEAFNRAGEQLVDAIAASVEHDAATNGSFTQAVSLTGGTALLPGLKERLQHRLGVSVQIGRPWARVLPHKRNDPYRRDDQDDPVLMLQLATAIGLAQWKDRS